MESEKDTLKACKASKLWKHAIFKKNKKEGTIIFTANDKKTFLIYDHLLSDKIIGTDQTSTCNILSTMLLDAKANNAKQRRKMQFQKASHWFAPLPSFVEMIVHAPAAGVKLSDITAITTTTDPTMIWLMFLKGKARLLCNSALCKEQLHKVKELSTNRKLFDECKNSALWKHATFKPDGVKLVYSVDGYDSVIFDPGYVFAPAFRKQRLAKGNPKWTPGVVDLVEGPPEMVSGMK